MELFPDLVARGPDFSWIEARVRRPAADHGLLLALQGFASRVPTALGPSVSRECVTFHIVLSLSGACQAGFATGLRALELTDAACPQLGRTGSVGALDLASGSARAAAVRREVGQLWDIANRRLYVDLDDELDAVDALSWDELRAALTAEGLEADVVELVLAAVRDQGEPPDVVASPTKIGFMHAVAWRTFMRGELWPFTDGARREDEMWARLASWETALADRTG